MDKLDHKIAALRRRVAELLQGNSDNRQPQQLLSEAFKELHSALEELEVAAQKLRQQNLEELCLAQAAVEAERQRYQDLF